MNMSRSINFAILVLLTLVLSACDTSEDKTGACTGYSSSLNHTYCYSGWTKSECSDHDNEKVNGADWYWYKGQSCSDRGLNEGSN